MELNKLGSGNELGKHFSYFVLFLYKLIIQGLMDFAFALSHRDREMVRRNHEPQPASTAENSVPEPTNEENAETVPEVTLDALFSPERERQFKINLLKTLIGLEETQKNSVIISQLLVVALKCLNPDEIDEVQIIDLVASDLITRVKTQRPQLLTILTLDEIINISQSFGRHLVTLIIDAELPAVFFDCVSGHLESLFNYNEPENIDREVIKLPSPFDTADQKPFRNS